MSAEVLPPPVLRSSRMRDEERERASATEVSREFNVGSVRLSRQPGRSVGEVAKVCCGGGGTNSRRKETPRLPGSGSKPGWGKRFASCGPRLSGCGGA